MYTLPAIGPKRNHLNAFGPIEDVEKPTKRQCKPETYAQIFFRHSSKALATREMALLSSVCREWQLIITSEHTKNFTEFCALAENLYEKIAAGFVSDDEKIAAGFVSDAYRHCPDQSLKYLHHALKCIEVFRQDSALFTFKSQMQTINDFCKGVRKVIINPNVRPDGLPQEICVTQSSLQQRFLDNSQKLACIGHSIAKLDANNIDYYAKQSLNSHLSATVGAFLKLKCFKVAFTLTELYDMMVYRPLLEKRQLYKTNFSSSIDNALVNNYDGITFESFRIDTAKPFALSKAYATLLQLILSQENFQETFTIILDITSETQRNKAWYALFCSSAPQRDSLNKEKLTQLSMWFEKIRDVLKTLDNFSLLKKQAVSLFCSCSLPIICHAMMLSWQTDPSGNLFAQSLNLLENFTYFLTSQLTSDEYPRKMIDKSTYVLQKALICQNSLFVHHNILLFLKLISDPLLKEKLVDSLYTSFQATMFHPIKSPNSWQLLFDLLQTDIKCSYDAKEITMCFSKYWLCNDTQFFINELINPSPGFKDLPAQFLNVLDEETYWLARTLELLPESETKDNAYHALHDFLLQYDKNPNMLNVLYSSNDQTQPFSSEESVQEDDQ